MPSEGRSRKAVRMDNSEWEAFGEAAAELGWDRSSLIRDFAKWFREQPERVTYRRRQATPEDLKPSPTRPPAAT